MKSPRSKKRSGRIDPDAIKRQASESLAKTERQQGHVNALTAYLMTRSDQNGFKEDFGIDIRIPCAVPKLL